MTRYEVMREFGLDGLPDWLDAEGDSGKCRNTDGENVRRMADAIVQRDATITELRERLAAVEDRERALSDACYASERELAASRAECAAMRAVVEAAERMVDVQAQIEVLDVVDGDMAAYSQAETELGALYDNAEHDIHEALRAYRATTPQGGGATGVQP